MKKSFAVRLSLRFMFVLTTSIILLSVSFLYFIRSLVKANQTKEMKIAEHVVLHTLEQQDVGVNELPYYLTYIAYDSDSEEVLATNDPFLPLLKDTDGKAVHHLEKNFFFDGDLDIFYYAGTHDIKLSGEEETRAIVVAVAMNIENDSFSMIFTKLPRALLLMTLPVLLLSFFVCLLITKNTMKPVVKITHTAQTMGIENLDGQLPITGQGDEIDELSNTFNDLFKRIKADFDRERQFSSDVSHELNTPLTVIMGQANLLLRWGKDNPEQLEKSLNAIKDESKSMHSIIENLLQISRIESGRIKPQNSEVDVRALFERVEQEFAAVVPDVKFVILCNPTEKLQTDSEMLHQILTVFVSNSVKFAEGHCTIKLMAMRDETGRLVVSEEDDGPGISEEALPHVFERFFRADEAHTRAVGGSGLGLSIAKTLADAMGAEIAVSNALPHGAIFRIIYE